MKLHSESSIRLPLLVFLSFVPLFLLTGCPSKTVVKELTKVRNDRKALEKPRFPKKQTNKVDGVTYRLPRTVILVTIPIKKTVERPGAFVDFAPCFFSNDEVENATMIPKSTFLIEEPNFGSKGEPDPEHTFVVNTRGNYFQSKTVFMEFANGGVLTKGEAESTDNSLDFAVKTISAVAGLGMDIVKSQTGAGTLRIMGLDNTTREVRITRLGCALSGFKKRLEALKGVFSAMKITDAEEKELASPNFDANTERKKQLKYYSAQIASIETKISYLNTDPEIGYSNELEKKLDTASKEQRARLIGTINVGNIIEDDYGRALSTYNKLELMQLKRDRLVSSAENVPAETFKLMIDKTDSAIEAYRAAFLGESEVRIWAGEFEYRPEASIDAGMDKEATVMNFSTSGGICIRDSDEIARQKIRINPAFINSNEQDHPCGIQIRIDADRSNSGNSDDDYIKQIDLATDNSQTSGWYFRIPRRAQIRVYQFTAGQDKMRNLAVKEMMVAQYGIVSFMPAKTAGKTSSSMIVLDESSGALKNFKVSSSPLIDESMLKDAEGAAKKIIDAGDPISKKKRELELLKLQNQIIEERKKLESANSPSPRPTP